MPVAVGWPEIAKVVYLRPRRPNHEWSCPQQEIGLEIFTS